MGVKKVVVGVAVFSLLAVSLGLCYRAEAGENLKVGYVDVGAVLDRYAKRQELEKALEKEKQTKQKEIDEKLKEMEKLEKELEAKASLLKEEEKQQREKIIKEKRKEHLRLFQQSQLEIRDWALQQQREIFKEIQEAIRSYGQENNYTLILDGREVLYGLEELDLTDQIINLLNKPTER